MTTPQITYPLSQKIATGTLARLAEGIVEFQPDKASENGLIISVGIHGNETAPIEILDSLLQDIFSEQVSISRPALFIFGNLAAIKQHTRFISHNMNRLFCGKHADMELSMSIDAIRAREIERACYDFAHRSAITEHFDLHTAIRDSEYPRFALYPYRSVAGVNAHPQQTQLQFLVQSGVETLLIQSSDASTFSAFTAKTFEAESYTVELGKVKPFGQNDLAAYRNLRTSLEALLSSSPINQTIESLQTFEISHEIIHTGKGFILNIPENEKNFSAFPKGYVVWEDGKSQYRVQHDQEFIVFPNSTVPKGQRAGLMLKRVH